MTETKVMKLDLRESLLFKQHEEARNPSSLAQGVEWMLFFELDPTKTGSIESAVVPFLGDPLLSASTDTQGIETAIPQGTYLFAQTKQGISKTMMDMLAIEIQKEGIYRGLSMSDKVFIRLILEEEGPVLQVFRPLTRRL